MRNNGDSLRIMDLKSLFPLKYSMYFVKAANPQGCLNYAVTHLRASDKHRIAST